VSPRGVIDSVSRRRSLGHDRRFPEGEGKRSVFRKELRYAALPAIGKGSFVVGGALGNGSVRV
jgi:hypothetical protein